MYRIRFHGRGGQGMRRAGRILGTAFFLAGFEVQDAPRYGAERRGAPIFAFVRADRRPVHERGIIGRPDLVVVADDTLIPVPAAGIMAGVTAATCLLVNSAVDRKTWQERLQIAGPLFILPGVRPEDPLAVKRIGAQCAGAAAALIGVLSRHTLQQAIAREIADLGEEAVRSNLDDALAAFDLMQEYAGAVQEGGRPAVQAVEPPAWVDLHLEGARLAAPAIHAAATSVQMQTGVWRTMRPVINYERCNRCWWLCSTFCPDSAIAVDADRYPQIDYDHCKGCMVCMVQCPAHAIEAVAEQGGISAGGEVKE